MQNTRKRIYVGLKHGGGREGFKSLTTPTEQSHGEHYAAVIGPFQTARGAAFMVRYGEGNPHVQCVADAERLARKTAVSAESWAIAFGRTS